MACSGARIRSRSQTAPVVVRALARCQRHTRLCPTSIADLEWRSWSKTLHRVPILPMSFLLLLVFTLACWPDNWQAFTWGPLASNPLLSTAATWVALSAVVAIAGRIARRTQIDLQLRPALTESTLDRYRRWRQVH